MLIYVRITEQLKQRVDTLISRGHYSSVNTVITVALENLLLAEEEAEKVQSQKPPTATRTQPGVQLPAKKTPAVDRVAETPRIWCWANPVDLSEKHLAPLPADLFQPGQRVPVERWVFGQQNRVLPAKVNSRLFAMLVAKRESEVELFEAAQEISTQAVDVYAFLNELDTRFDHGKDDLLSTGFPEPGSDKAISRYANHFAAYETSQGNLTGMLIQWKLAGVKRAKNKTFLLPTKACLDFAALPNPLLDQPVMENPTVKFSPAEISWAIKHIASHVPVEASAFTFILSGLKQGFTTPDGLDSFVREQAKEKADVSPAFVSTQRSGAISRMADLNLVKRQRDGTKVSYEVTELGTDWLENQIHINSK